MATSDSELLGDAPIEIHGMGWRPQLPDFRDYSYADYLAALPPKALELPATVDLRPHMPKVYDQGQFGSCTANAGSGAFEYRTIRQGIHDFKPSRLYNYYFERELHGWQNQDSGAYVRDTLKIMADPLRGVCDERVWPYNPSLIYQRPNQHAILDATQRPHRKALSYYAVNRDITLFKQALVNDDPIIIGFSVYQSFYNIGANGLMPVPKQSESLLGGHAVLIVGYTNDNHFIVRNSWGPNWGKAGYFFMPEQVILNDNLSSDFWVLVTV